MFILDELVRPNIRRLKPYASARQEYKGKAALYLDANENPFDSGLNRYPDPLQWAVKEKVSALKEIAPEHIFLGNGSDELIDLLIRIFCEPGKDQILVLPPTYGMYQVAADIADVEVVEVPLSSDFQPNVAAILAATTARTKILFLCSPNNPTGNCLDTDKILNLIQNFRGIVLLDEAYIDFAQEPSFLEQLKKYPNLVILQTFSKAWGLAGLRMGMGFASVAIIDLLNKVKAPYNISVVNQKELLKVLDNHSQYLTELTAIITERERLRHQLSALPFVEKLYPSDANFILMKVAAPNELYEFLITQGIVVRNRSKVLLCEGCLRITVGTASENDILLKVLNLYLEVV